MAFSRRLLTTAVEQIYPVKMGLVNLFWKGKVSMPSTVRDIEIEIKKGNRGVAKYTDIGLGGNFVDKSGYSRLIVQAPFIDEYMVTRATDFFDKDFGKSPFASQDQKARALARIGRELKELKERAERSKIIQARDLLINGAIRYSVDGREHEVDFLMPDSHKIELDTKWSDKDSNPIQDLKEFRRLVAKDSGLSPDAVVMGTEAIDTFFNNEKVKSYYHTRRIIVDNIKADATADKDGLVYYGSVEGMKLYTYDEYFTNEYGELVPVIPNDTIILGSTEAKVSIEHGAIPMSNNKIVWLEAKKEVGYTTTDKSSDSMLVRYKTSPLLTLTQSDAFLSAKVL